jgi:hypothetical protein
MLQQTGMIMMEEHDRKRCAYIFQNKNQNHYQSHKGQNNITKVHTPYSKDYRMKDVVNASKQK